MKSSKVQQIDKMNSSDIAIYKLNINHLDYYNVNNLTNINNFGKANNIDNIDNIDNFNKICDNNQSEKSDPLEDFDKIDNFDKMVKFINIKNPFEIGDKWINIVNLRYVFMHTFFLHNKEFPYKNGKSFNKALKEYNSWKPYLLDIGTSHEKIYIHYPEEVIKCARDWNICNNIPKQHNILITDDVVKINNRQSKGETLCKNYLSSNNITYEYQFRFSNYKVRFYDFKFTHENHKYILEYDGIQHFNKSKLYHKTFYTFLKQQKRDRKKMIKAIQNGYHIIRIDYTQESNIKEHIDKALTLKQKIYYSTEIMYEYLSEYFRDIPNNIKSADKILNIIEKLFFYFETSEVIFINGEYLSADNVRQIIIHEINKLTKETLSYIENTYTTHSQNTTFNMDFLHKYDSYNYINDLTKLSNQVRENVNLLKRLTLLRDHIFLNNLANKDYVHVDIFEFENCFDEIVIINDNNTKTPNETGINEEFISDTVINNIDYNNNNNSTNNNTNNNNNEFEVNNDNNIFIATNNDSNTPTLNNNDSNTSTFNNNDFNTSTFNNNDFNTPTFNNNSNKPTLNNIQFIINTAPRVDNIKVVDHNNPQNIAEATKIKRHKLLIEKLLDTARIDNPVDEKFTLENCLMSISNIDAAQPGLSKMERQFYKIEAVNKAAIIGYLLSAVRMFGFTGFFDILEIHGNKQDLIEYIKTNRKPIEDMLMVKFTESQLTPIGILKWLNNKLESLLCIKIKSLTKQKLNPKYIIDSPWRITIYRENVKILHHPLEIILDRKEYLLSYVDIMNQFIKYKPSEKIPENFEDCYIAHPQYIGAIVITNVITWNRFVNSNKDPEFQSFVGELYKKYLLYTKYEQHIKNCYNIGEKVLSWNEFLAKETNTTKPKLKMTIKY